MRAVTRFLALALLLAGCSSNAINGAVDGKTLIGTASAVGRFVDQGTLRAATTVLVTNVVNPCQAIRDNKDQKNTTGLILFLLKKAGDDRTAAAEPGTYLVADWENLPDGLVATVLAFNLDGECVNAISDAKVRAISGKIVLEAIAENGPASGTFDLEFAGGDKVTGEFAAGFCDAQPATEDPTCG